MLICFLPLAVPIGQGETSLRDNDQQPRPDQLRNPLIPIAL